MEQYNSIQQILKKENEHDRKPIYPSTVIQAVFDAKTGASLEAILAQFNSIYVQYQGSPQATRNIIPVEMRRAGLMITYMNMDSETITEKALSSVQKDNDQWSLEGNWVRLNEAHNQSVGATEERPILTEYKSGYLFYDTTIKKPIWWNGESWTDANGVEL